MPCEYVKADDGHVWVTTEAGEAIGRIAAKFQEGGHNRQRYNIKVPKCWITKGWVKQVKA